MLSLSVDLSKTDCISSEVKGMQHLCAVWKKKHPPLEDFPDGLPIGRHACTLNHKGSASSMEPKAALDMIIRLYDRTHVSIDRICIDDDASTPVLLRLSNADHCINNNTDKPPQVRRKITNMEWRQGRTANSVYFPGTESIYARTICECSQGSHSLRSTFFARYLPWTERWEVEFWFACRVALAVA
jgi:hypothetical protein